MAMKRSGKEYRNNEKEVMKMLGLNPTKNSGSGWVEKEDGISENIICQLKSTDAQSIRVVKQDLDTLQYNAVVSHKLPVFVIQFLQSNELYLLVKPGDIEDIVQYIKTGEAPRQLSGIDLKGFEHISPEYKRVVRSSQSARDRHNKTMQDKYSKKWRSAT